MSKHTPGPWSVSDEHGSVGGVKCATGFVAFPTCSPRQIDETRNAGESWIEMRDRTAQARDALKNEIECNARLIAAAPALLAALQSAADSLAQMATYHNDEELALIVYHMRAAARRATE